MPHDDNDWRPIPLEKLNELVADGEAMLDDAHLRFWNAIRIAPRKWALSPWGDLGGGFWVVGLIGSTVLWYNDIEDGFNTSRFHQLGLIDEYWCDDMQLNHVVHQLRGWIVDAEPMLRKFGPPQPLTPTDPSGSG